MQTIFNTNLHDFLKNINTTPKNLYGSTSAGIGNIWNNFSGSMHFYFSGISF